MKAFCVLAATACLAAGCDDSARPCEPVFNTYDIVELELPARRDDATWAVLDIDGTGEATNPVGRYLFPLSGLYASTLPSNAERVAALVAERRFLWRLKVESCETDGAPQSIELVSYDEGDELPRQSAALATEPEDLSTPIARDGEAHIPLGLLFDGSEQPEPGWQIVAGVAVAPEYRDGPLERSYMTGRIGFGLIPGDLSDIVLPALARTASRMLADEPTGPARLIDGNEDGQVSPEEIEFLLDTFEPDLDLFHGASYRRVYARAQDGVKESSSFSFRFRANRICGGDDFSCQDR